MKQKLLLGLMLTAILSTNSFAMKITHGKLLGHKEWTTGKFLNTSFKEVDNLKISALQMPTHKMRSSAQPPYGVDIVSTVSWVHGDTSSVLNQGIALSGFAEVQIMNNSPVSKTYTVTTNLISCYAGTDNMSCELLEEATSQDIIALDVGGYARIVRAPYAVTSYSTPGDSYYWIETDVQTDGGTLFESRSREGTITILDDNVKK